MPIDKQEWDSGRKAETFEARILKLLRDNRGYAFTPSEIISRLGYKLSIKNLSSFVGSVSLTYLIEEALKTLVEEGSVLAKIIETDFGELTYYIAK